MLSLLDACVGKFKNFANLENRVGVTITNYEGKFYYMCKSIMINVLLTLLETYQNDNDENSFEIF